MVRIIALLAVIYVLTPVVTWKLTGWLNGYLTSRFPTNTAYTRKCTHFLELSREKHYQKYIIGELIMFMIVFISIMLLYVAGPIFSFGRLTPGLVGRDLRWPSIPYVFGGILAAIPHAAYTCNYLIRGLFKLFNPSQDSRVLYFGSRVMNPSTVGHKAEYNIIDGHARSALVLTAVWVICLVLVLSTYAVYTADSLILKNGPFQQETTYKFAAITITETSRKTYTPTGQSPHARHRISFSKQGSPFYSTALSDRNGTMEERIFRTLLPHIGNYSPEK